jgi:hypothetical protein
MSTKSSIKWNLAGDVGYHLYTDVFDGFDSDDPPVYLQLNGVHVELATMENGASVTVTIPAAIARELGLLAPVIENGVP